MKIAAEDEKRVLIGSSPYTLSPEINKSGAWGINRFMQAENAFRLTRFPYTKATGNPLTFGSRPLPAGTSNRNEGKWKSVFILLFCKPPHLLQLPEVIK